jgi:predicted nucleic acid-binding protein
VTSAVVNSSPLIHLGDIGRIDLLQILFDVVETPAAVVEEIRAKGDDDPAARAIAQAAWLSIVRTPEASAPLLAWDLGAGETAVLAQALTLPGTEAIIDDLSARRCAKAFGVPVCGTLGLVLRAARKGRVHDPVGILNQLRSAGMWLDPGLFEQVLSLARKFQ